MTTRSFAAFRAEMATPFRSATPFRKVRGYASNNGSEARPPEKKPEPRGKAEPFRTESGKAAERDLQRVAG